VTVVLVSLAGTGRHVYRKLFETPYTAEEWWAWLDFQAQELRRLQGLTGCPAWDVTQRPGVQMGRGQGLLQAPVHQDG